MIRGTTPTHIFKVPFDTSAIEKVRIIYAQNDEEIFVKTNEDCQMSENNITVTLSQEETLLFNYKSNAQIQMRILTAGGDALASNIKVVSVAKLLEEEVLS